MVLQRVKTEKGRSHKVGKNVFTTQAIKEEKDIKVGGGIRVPLRGRDLDQPPATHNQAKRGKVDRPGWKADHLLSCCKLHPSLGIENGLEKVIGPGTVHGVAGHG